MTVFPSATLLHVAERRHWDEARAAGGPYAMSTRGRTLADEGFVHCSSTEAQAATVLDRFYADVPRDDLVLLVIDRTALPAEVRYASVDGDLFPHVHGPIPLAAVIEVRPVPETR
ncbi:DUF952 domain-containing protein [Actinomadura atramentaria]|uniref:DUF952 domain-containing protein n=1 Tax=Actinomadura atramentaria TaxID=1990 RepID=UPI000379EEE3|nr:DUF952 domain-containing protein [Actinomadura atramentaria]